MSQIDIGNGLPSNSHKSQEMAEQFEPKKPDIPEFQGEVAGVKRKNKGSSFLRWLRKMFLSDQKPKDIVMNVLENQIVPGIKDNFRNSLISSVDMFMYQNSKPVTTQNNNVAYGKIFNSSTQTVSNVTKTSTQKSPTNPDRPDLNNGFTNPCFRDLNDRVTPEGVLVQGARTFLQMMKDYDFPTLSVHTLYMMRKKRIDYTWDAYGWTKEEIANVQIVHINNPEYPWMIDLPPAHVIS